MASLQLSRAGLRAAAKPARISGRRSALIVRASAGETPAATTTSAPAETTSAPVEAAPAPAAPAVAAAAVTTGGQTVSLFDAFTFSNPVGPETFNSRLAMLGITAAIGGELGTGESFLQQFQEHSGVVYATFALITLASLVPLLKGADPAAAFGPMTQRAEIANGRMAMIGIAGLLIVELTKNGALF